MEFAQHYYYYHSHNNIVTITELLLIIANVRKLQETEECAMSAHF